MSGIRIVLVRGLVIAAFSGIWTPVLAGGEQTESVDYQYQFESISIPKATAEEKTLERFSSNLALDYLDLAAVAWTGSRKCVSCHTNGAYMTIRPALTEKLGKPPEQGRKFFETTLQQQLATDKEQFRRGVASAQVIYVAAGLAEWDAHVTKKLSPQTEQALALMFDLQQENGAWTAPSDCWPPFESDAYHGATLAVMAVATAPGWLTNLQDEKLRTKVERLKRYLLREPPPHDYGRVWLLWTATRMRDLLAARDKQALVDMVWRHQQPDGGWSIRTFAKPEEWGSGKRTEKLRAEQEFENPRSDGHQTGLALIALHEAGVPVEEQRIQRGLRWLLTNQRSSGRWWTRSLNTDNWHFITLSGTGYALLALSLYDALPD